MSDKVKQSEGRGVKNSFPPSSCAHSIKRCMHDSFAKKSLLWPDLMDVSANELTVDFMAGHRVKHKTVDVTVS